MTSFQNAGSARPGLHQSQFEGRAMYRNPNPIQYKFYTSRSTVAVTRNKRTQTGTPGFFPPPCRTDGLHDKVVRITARSRHPGARYPPSARSAARRNAFPSTNGSARQRDLYGIKSSNSPTRAGFDTKATFLPHTRSDARRSHRTPIRVDRYAELS